MPIISVPDEKFTNFIEQDHANKRAAQKKKDLKEYPPQAVLRGSPTRDWDNDLAFVIKQDRETVGSPNPPTFWAMEIARTIRDFKGPAKESYDAIITNAEQNGLSKGQKQAIDNILVHWRIPVPGIKSTIDDSSWKDIFAPVESDSTISFSQRQVAAALKDTRELKARIASMEQLLKHYNARRASLHEAFSKQELKDRVARLLKANFSRQDIATDMASWDFPKSLIRQAMSSLLPKKVALSNGQRFALSNDLARQVSARRIDAAARLSKHYQKKAELLTEKQKLRLSALATKYELDTPFWIRTAQKNKPKVVAVPDFDDDDEDEDDDCMSNAEVKAETIAALQALASGERHLDLSAMDALRDLTEWGFYKGEAIATFRRNGDAAIKVAKQALAYAKSLPESLFQEGRSGGELYEKVYHFAPIQVKPTKVKASAKLNDGRVLVASIEPDGQCTYTTRFDPTLKKAIRKTGSLEAGWLHFVKAQASETFEQRMQRIQNMPKPELSTEDWAKKTMEPLLPKEPDNIYLITVPLVITECINIDRLFSDYGAEQALKKLGKDDIVDAVRSEYNIEERSYGRRQPVALEKTPSEEGEEQKKTFPDFDSAYEEYENEHREVWKNLQNEFCGHGTALGGVDCHTHIDDLPDDLPEEVANYFQSEWNEAQMAKYLPDELKTKIPKIEADLPDGRQWHLRAYALEELTPEEIEKLEDWIKGQSSDGFGEGAEQHEFKSDHGASPSGDGEDIPTSYSVHMRTNRSPDPTIVRIK